MVIFYPQYNLALESIKNEDFQHICDGMDLKKDIALLPRLAFRDDIPEIVFDNVTFSYPNSSELFHNINLKISSGSQVGIIGMSGTGKSTLLMLITGILKPILGSILINQMPAEQYMEDPDVRIGYVGVEPFLIKGSLKENLCYGVLRDISDKELLNTLNLVSLQDLAADKGLSFEISEDQSGLSSGQKQRICLARAILNKPHLLILDEATANLDEQNERFVAEILNHLKGTCTTLIVSHRPGILAFADKVIEMKNL